MRFEVVVDRQYPHPVEDVWWGITTPHALDQWLMETRGFIAQAGCRFVMTCEDGDGHLHTYRCEILEIDPPYRMLWSWVLAGNEDQGLTHVEFRVEPTPVGARLTILHRGDRDRAMLERFKAGWPFKLATLADVLNAQRE